MENERGNSSKSTKENELVFEEDPKSDLSFHYLLLFFQMYYPPGFLKKVMAEVIATYLLVFVTCGAAALSASDEHKVSRLGASVAGGLIVTVMIYAVGHISGAHMNPAVTFAFAAVRHFPWRQIGELAGIAVGSAVCITSILAGPVSGGSMNPARTIGPAMASNDYRAIWVYIIGPVCGTLLGAWSYNFIKVTDKPVQAIAQRQSFSFKLRRMKSNDDEEQCVNKDPLNA